MRRRRFRPPQRMDRARRALLVARRRAPLRAAAAAFRDKRYRRRRFQSRRNDRSAPTSTGNRLRRLLYGDAFFGHRRLPLQYARLHALPLYGGTRGERQRLTAALSEDLCGHDRFLRRGGDSVRISRPAATWEPPARRRLRRVLVGDSLDHRHQRAQLHNLLLHDG